MPSAHQIGVIGAGAWGTALAQTMALAGNSVTMWDRNEQVLADINRRHLNSLRHPGTMLEENLTATDDLFDLVEKSSIVLIALPSEANSPIAAQIGPKLRPNQILALSSKGFRESDGALLSQVWDEVSPAAGPTVVLTGPTFAAEMIARKPTSFVVAGYDAQARAAVADQFLVPFVRTFEHDDPIGAQVGGAIKNVLAVASGLLDGLDMGHNARAAMLSRGLIEMGRYARALGGKEQTIWGLAGMGDLLLTATSSMSRNYKFGHMVGRGTSPAEAKQRIGTVEGVLAARIVTIQAQSHGIDLAIVSAVDGVLHGDITPLKAVDYLMQRPREYEFDI